MNLGDGMAGGGDNRIQKAEKGADRVDESRNVEAEAHARMLADTQPRTGDATTGRPGEQTLASAGAIESGISNVARVLSQPNEQYGTLGKACAAECPEGMKELMRTAQEVQQNYAKLASAGFTADVDPKQGKAIMAALEKVTKAV